ncbi:MAG: hypothetical protein IPP14_09330 [Planctomycetes bacterium]|nr:hypothetical protein [Planctomycetota bacterium]
MRRAVLLTLLFGLLAAAMPAIGFGDLAPRNTLGYARARNLGEGLRRLAGDDWNALYERALKLRNNRDREDSDPMINEVRKFIDHAGAVEFALVDLMVRDPHVQVVVVAHLDETAPKAFSEDLLKWLKEMREESLKFTATEITAEDFTLRLQPGFLVMTVGGAAREHVTDVLQGDTSESLSKVERFKKWSEASKQDIEAWVDMKSLRSAIDKMGEDMRIDSDTQQVLDLLEWQKWDVITGSLALPGKTGGGLALNIDLSFSQPVESLNALLRPTGSARMIRTLPAETLGFVSAQIGADAESTWKDICRMVHDGEQRARPASLRRQVEWAKNSLEYSRQELARLEKGEDGSDEDKDFRGPGDEEPTMPEPEPENREEQIKRIKDQIKYQEQELAELEQQVRDFKSRAFSTDDEGRTSQSSDGEEMWDKVRQFLKQVGVEPAEMAQVIGGEVIAGFVGLPDTEPDSMEDMFRALWFVNIELREGQEAVKKKIIDFALGKSLPADATEDQKEEARRRAESMLFKKVEGGEVLRPKGGFGGQCIFFADTFCGMAGNEDVALRILKAAAGGKTLAPGNVPGGTAGSKLLYIDLGELIARGVESDRARSSRWRQFSVPDIDVRKLLKSGLRLGVTTGESPTRITLNAATAGEPSLRGLLEALVSEGELGRAWNHDRDMLDELGNGLSQWLDQNRESLQTATAEDAGKKLKGVSPASLMNDGYFSPQDGMRSAFDPAMVARLKAMIESGSDVLGGEGGAGDMKESGYDWYGLPAKWDFNAGGGYRWGELHNSWLVCATKGPWLRGGRACVVFNGTNVQTMWLDEDSFKQLVVTNRGGSRLKEIDTPLPVLPRWKAKLRLSNERWTAQGLRDRVRNAVETAAAEGREFQLDFNGSRAEDTIEKLRKAFAIGDDDWFEIEQAKNIEIEAKGDKCRVRLKQGDDWIEVDQDGKMTTSWDNE